MNLWNLCTFQWVLDLLKRFPFFIWNACFSPNYSTSFKNNNWILVFGRYINLADFDFTLTSVCRFRFVLVAEDGVVKGISVEPDGTGFTCSKVDDAMKFLWCFHRVTKLPCAPVSFWERGHQKYVPVISNAVNVYILYTDERAFSLWYTALLLMRFCGYNVTGKEYRCSCTLPEPLPLHSFSACEFDSYNNRFLSTCHNTAVLNRNNSCCSEASHTC